MILRETARADRAEILDIHRLAFPDEDLRPLVSALLDSEAGILSLAAGDGGAIVAHALFTGTVAGDAALLGPVAVLPAHQRRGVGSATVRGGLARLAESGTAQVFVLGDPAYYGRLGFAPERDVVPPFPLPQEWEGAWQSRTLEGRAPLPAGPIALPAPWMDPALWRP